MWPLHSEQSQRLGWVYGLSLSQCTWSRPLWIKVQLQFLLRIVIHRLLQGCFTGHTGWWPCQWNLQGWSPLLQTSDGSCFLKLTGLGFCPIFVLLQDPPSVFLWVKVTWSVCALFCLPRASHIFPVLPCFLLRSDPLVVIQPILPSLHIFGRSLVLDWSLPDV